MIDGEIATNDRLLYTDNIENRELGTPKEIINTDRVVLSEK